VLFVGNSYTYVHSVPEILKTFADKKGHELIYEQQTPGGRSFQKHWEEKKAVKKMKTGNFDLVVFQNHSFEPVSDPDNMVKYGKLLAAEAANAGAKILYYQTMAYKEPLGWMKKDNEVSRRGLALFNEMNERLVESYSRLAKETGGEVAPVGTAWKLAYESVPGLQLHGPDHSHAAPAGAYLTALVFYASLFDEDPKNMPRKMTIETLKKGKPHSEEIRIDSKTRKALEAATKDAMRTVSKTN
jgi:hypothetical protein